MATFLEVLADTGIVNEAARAWDGFNAYKRACAAEEAALLDAHEAAMIEQERRELDEIARTERESFFQRVRTEIASISSSA